MIAGLKRCIRQRIAVLAAVVALTVAVLAILPGMAEAQEEKGAVAPATPPAHSGVVAPGDSLWSISQARLGPSASPQHIARDVQRIHEINRTRIGDDPNRIFPGQRLELPPPAGAPATEAPAARPSGPAARTAVGAAGEAPEQDARLAPGRTTEPIALPALPEGGAVPQARSLASHAASGGGLGVLGNERRRLLGLGIIALTLLLAGLMAWRLPMRRVLAEDADVWGLPMRRRVVEHAEARELNRRYYFAGRRYHHDRQDADSFVEGKPRSGPGPIANPVRGHEPGGNGAAGPPTKGLTVAHDPLIRRTLRCSSRGASTPGRPPRNRSGAARGPLGRASRRSRRAVMRRRSASLRPAKRARGRNP